jgi:hypothetical protein
MFFSGKKTQTNRTESPTYDEKDTRQKKLLQCVAHICRHVTYFVGNLGNAIGNWHISIHSATNSRFQLFYLYEMLRVIASLFFARPCEG